MRARSLPVLPPPCWPRIVSALPRFSIPWISSWYIVYSLDWGVWKIVWRHDFLSCCHLTWAVERVLLEFPRRHRRWRGVWFAYEPLAGDHEMSCIRCSPILFSPLRLESPECIPLEPGAGRLQSPSLGNGNTVKFTNQKIINLIYSITKQSISLETSHAHSKNIIVWLNELSLNSDLCSTKQPNKIFLD